MRKMRLRQVKYIVYNGLTSKTPALSLSWPCCHFLLRIPWRTMRRPQTSDLTSFPSWFFPYSLRDCSHPTLVQENRLMEPCPGPPLLLISPCPRGKEGATKESCHFISLCIWEDQSHNGSFCDIWTVMNEALLLLNKAHVIKSFRRGWI